MHCIKYRSIDPEVLRQAVGHDEDAFRDLSQTFLRIAPPMLARLQAAVLAGDCAALTLESHSLKSTAALVGAGTLSRLFADLEAHSRRGDCAAVAQALPDANTEFAQVMREVRDSIGHR